MRKTKYSAKPRPENLENEELTRRIIGCAIAVHKALGPGHQESVYHTALALELEKRGLKVEKEGRVKIYYEGEHVGDYVLDLLVDGTCAIKFKSNESINANYANQLIRYQDKDEIGAVVLINFKEPVLEVDLFINPSVWKFKKDVL